MIRTARRLAVLSVAALGVIGLTAGPASAAPGNGTYYGNQCQSSNWYLDNAGAEACVWRDRFVPNGSLSITAGAFDYASDGRSANNRTTVQQYFPGYGWSAGSSIGVTASRGYGFSQVGSSYTFNKASGASHVRVIVRACTYDVPTATYFSCASKVVASGAWSG